MRKHRSHLSRLPLSALAMATVWITFASASHAARHFQRAAHESTKVGNEVQSAGTEKWGIEITSIRLTAHGHMIDFRYRVLDAEKAEALFVRQTKPRLIHQGTGKVLSVPETAKVGPLRNSNEPQKGKIYWMFFGNGGKVVQKGDKVTVVIGDFKVENLEVE